MATGAPHRERVASVVVDVSGIACGVGVAILVKVMLGRVRLFPTVEDTRPDDMASAWTGAVTAVVACVVGAIAAVLAKREVAARVLGFLVIIVGFVGVLVVGSGPGPVSTPPPPADGPRYCQEHSGGDTRCPGG